MPLLLPFSCLPTFGPGGFPVMDALLFVFAANTTSPVTAYSDPGLSIPLTHPIKADGSSGCFPIVYVPGGTYRLRVTDGTGVQIREIEGYAVADAVAPGGGGSGNVDTTRLAQTGDVKDRYAAGVHAGWVRMNGRTIGPSSSDASERANDDAHDLFVHLWQTDATLAVSGGRGPNAESDWAASKTIALPDQRGRARIALDTLGNGNAGRLLGGLFLAGDPSTVGATMGEAAHTLTVAQLPSFTVPVSASMDTQGIHQHGGTTSGFSSDHNHAISVKGYPFTQGGPLTIFTPVTSGGDATIPTNGTSNNHTHTFGTDFQGAHAHNITVSVGSVGGGQSFSLLPPALLVSSYIKL